MKKWSEIKQATLDKLFMTEAEASQQDYLAKFQRFANEALNIIANGVKPQIKAFRFSVLADDVPTAIGDYHIKDVIAMPEDFISFSDMTNYHNNTPWNDIVYLGDRYIAVGELGDYVIYYNALWEEITDDNVNPKIDTPLTTHISVLNCLPTYIASQCLAQDDVQRSASLRNEFESMLSRLDTNIMYQEQHYQSKGGWY